MASFFGADPQTSVGLVTNVAGGLLIVGDIGSIIKNLWRMAGFSNTPVNWPELILSGMGLATEVFIGVGEVPDVPISIARALVAKAGNGVFSNSVAWLVKSAIANQHAVLELTASLLAMSRSGADVAGLKIVYGARHLQNALLRSADVLGEDVAPAFVHATRELVDAHGRRVAQNTASLFADPRFTEALHSIQQTLRNQPALAPHVVSALGKTVAVEIGPEALVTAFKNARLFGGSFNETVLALLLRDLADAGTMGLSKLVNYLRVTNGNRDLGTLYEAAVAQRIVTGQIPSMEGATLEVIEKFVKSADGRTDIDLIARLPGGQAVFIQVKRTAGAFDLERERNWIRKVRGYAQENGYAEGSYLIRCVTSNSSALPDDFLNLLERMFPNDPLRVLPDVPIPGVP